VRLAERSPGLYRLVRDKFYVDEIYYMLVIRPVHVLSRRVLFRVVDSRIVDGLVNLAGHLSRGFSYAIRFAETGQAQSYAFVILAAVAVLLWKAF
jgi:NADH-quinone oxidoreductase subunit L